jgi:hypothetical protein
VVVGVVVVEGLDQAEQLDEYPKGGQIYLK